MSTVENNLRFPGQYYDIETGLHYNWNRYYHPQSGRYITPDPIGLAGGLNLYAYAGGDPVNWFDPFGLDRIKNGIIYDDCGNITGEVPLEEPLFSPADVLGFAGGIAKFTGRATWKFALKSGYSSTGRVITKNGEPVIIRGKQVSPHAIEQAVDRGVPAKEIMKALAQGVPKTKMSMGESSVVRKAGKAIVTTKENDTIITTIIGKQRPQF